MLHVRHALINKSVPSSTKQQREITTFTVLAPVVQTLDSALHWINHYPLDNSIGFASVYPLDSNLSGGQRYPSIEQLGPDEYLSIQRLIFSSV